MSARYKALDIFKRMVNTFSQVCAGACVANSQTGYVNTDFLYALVFWASLFCLFQHLPSLLDAFLPTEPASPNSESNLGEGTEKKSFQVDLMKEDESVGL